MNISRQSPTPASSRPQRAALSTPSRDGTDASCTQLAQSPPAQQSPQPAESRGVPVGSSLISSDSELGSATALVVHIHRELAVQGVPELQRALIAGNVLEALRLTQQERQHATSSGYCVNLCACCRQQECKLLQHQLMQACVWLCTLQLSAVRQAQTPSARLISANFQ